MASREQAPREQISEVGRATVIGSVPAAILASGIGCFVIGLLTTLASASPAISSALNFVRPVGSLSGKTTIAVIAWLIAWVVLHSMWRGQEVEFGRIYKATLVLIALGFLLTFPPFFELFAPG